MARSTDSITPSILPLAVTSPIAIILPGEAGPTSPVPKSIFVATPVIPPAITAKNNAGFINTYGK